MNTKIRLTRKPLTTALWTILVAAMALLLSVGAAMMYSSGSLAGILDKYHTSIAVRTDRGHWEDEVIWSNGEVLPMNVYADKSFDEEDEAWFESLDCVEEVYFHTASAAYSPELVPAINPAELTDAHGRYSGVVLVGEITELTAVVDYSILYEDPDFQERCVYGVLRLEEMIRGHEGFMRRTADSDQYLNFKINLPNDYMDEIQVGRQYVLLGSYDPVSHGLNHLTFDVQIEAKHPWFVSVCGYASLGIKDGQPVYVEAESRDGFTYGAPYIKPIEGSLEEFLADPENGDFAKAIDRMDRQHHSLVVLGTENVNALHSFVTNNATVTDGRTFTDEEYSTGARVCMLSETVAMASAIQVGDTITLEQYLCANTSENPNLNYSLRDRSDDGMQNNPLISDYSIHTEYAPAEEFTVVGIYRIGAEWADNSYSFTPNTILIPKAAQIEGAYGGYSITYEVFSRTDIYGETSTVTDASCEGTYGIYFSIKLKNGMVSEFEDLMAADERFSGEFLTVDQGFGEVMESLEAISASTAKLLTVFLAGWLLLLALYVLLYQGSQRKNIGIMRSLGAAPQTAGDYLFKSGLTVAAVGVAVGSVVSFAVMGIVQSELLDNAIAQLPTKYSSSALTDEAVQMMAQESQLPVWMMLLLAAVQIAVFAAVLKLHAKRMAARKPRELLSK